MKNFILRITQSSFLLSAAWLLASPPASAQSIQVLLRSGDSVPGVSGGLVQSVSDVAVADDGSWVARTRFTVPNSTIDAAVANGIAVLIEGEDLVDPPGTMVVAFDELDLSPGGVLWGNVTTTGGSLGNEVMYRNLIPTAQENFDVLDPNQPPGTIWKDFDGFNLNDNGDLLILGDLDSPAVVGSSDSALVRQSFDASGLLTGETVLLLEGDILPGTTSQVKNVGTNSGAADVAHSNNNWIAYVESTDSSTSDEFVVLDGAVIAREGDAGPLPGTTWSSLSSNAVDVTNDGSTLFRGSYVDLFGSTVNSILVDSLPALQLGDTSPSIAPFTFQSFGINTPIKLAANGNFLTYAKTDNSDGSQDSGYFLNDRALIQEGLTTVGGVVLSSLTIAPNGLSMSPSGRYVVATAFDSNADQVMLMLDLGLVEVMSSATAAAAVLTHTDGLPLEGETLQLQMDGEQDLGVTPILLVSSDPVPGWDVTGQGLVTSIGELLVDISGGNPVITQVGLPSDFSPATFSIPIPTTLGLAGADFYAQGFYWDIGDVSPQENFRLTNGLQITLGQ